jgi:hypothetical protein
MTRTTAVGRCLTSTIPRNERQLVAAACSKPAIPDSAITCHSVTWPECPQRVEAVQKLNVALASQSILLL